MIDTLRLTNFRNLFDKELLFGNRVNVVYGNNGSGKTSLLEAIYVLNYGKTFRSSKLKHAIKKNCHAFTLFGKIKLDDEKFHHVGLTKSNTKDSVVIDSRKQVNLSEFSQRHPIQIIDPGSFYLLQGGPEVRRKFLDWGVFHVEHSFLNAWRRYKNSLKQRNALLRHDRIPRLELDIWTQNFCQSAMEVSRYREHYYSLMEEQLNQMIVETPLNEFQKFSIHYYPGWDTEKDLYRVLEETIDRDAKYKYTQYGPQKADIRLRIGSDNVINVLSRGQQKLLIALLKIIQTKVVYSLTGCQPTLLFDDIDSELDEDYLQTVINLGVQHNQQVFLTSTSLQVMSKLNGDADIRMFHVEHGVVSAGYQ